MPPRPPAQDAAGARMIDEAYADWVAYLAGTPAIDVHCDPDVSWTVHPGAAWSNCGVRPRFSPGDVDQRLDTLLARYAENGRGAGFWVGPFAEPPDLERHLRARGLHCRKYFPGMVADLHALPEVPPAAHPVTMGALEDFGCFRRHPHPYFGPITTAIRRHAVAARAHLATRQPRQTWDLVARDTIGPEAAPLGICTLFISGRVAAFFDVGVIDDVQRRGIGAALMAYACRVARDRGCDHAILISSGMGFGMYQRVGFREVARFGFWYTARPAAAGAAAAATTGGRSPSPSSSPTPAASGSGTDTAARTAAGRRSSRPPARSPLPAGSRYRRTR